MPPLRSDLLGSSGIDSTTGPGIGGEVERDPNRRPTFHGNLSSPVEPELQAMERAQALAARRNAAAELAELERKIAAQALVVEEAEKAAAEASANADAVALARLEDAVEDQEEVVAAAERKAAEAEAAARALTNAAHGARKELESMQNIFRTKSAEFDNPGAPGAPGAGEVPQQESGANIKKLPSLPKIHHQERLVMYPKLPLPIVDPATGIVTAAPLPAQKPWKPSNNATATALSNTPVAKIRPQPSISPSAGPAAVPLPLPRQAVASTSSVLGRPALGEFQPSRPLALEPVPASGPPGHLGSVGVGEASNHTNTHPQQLEEPDEHHHKLHVSIPHMHIAPHLRQPEIGGVGGARDGIVQAVTTGSIDTILPPPGVVDSGGGTNFNYMAHLRRASYNGEPAAIASAGTVTTADVNNVTEDQDDDEAQQDQFPQLDSPEAPTHAPGLGHIPAGNVALPEPFDVGFGDAIKRSVSRIQAEKTSPSKAQVAAVGVPSMDPSLATAATVAIAPSPQKTSGQGRKMSIQSLDNAPDSIDVTPRQVAVSAPPLMHSIGKPVTLLHNLVDLARLLPAPKSDPELQEQLDALALGVFPFISQRVDNIMVSLHDVGSIPPDTKQALGIVARVGARVVAVAANPEVVRAVSAAVKSLQRLALASLDRKVRDLPALRHAEGATSHAAAIRGVASDLSDILATPALETHLRGIPAALAASNTEDVDSLFRPLEFLGSTLVPVASAAGISLGKALQVPTVANEIVKRVASVEGLGQTRQTRVLQALHSALQRIETSRKVNNQGQQQASEEQNSTTPDKQTNKSFGSGHREAKTRGGVESMGVTIDEEDADDY